MKIVKVGIVVVLLATSFAQGYVMGSNVTFARDKRMFLDNLARVMQQTKGCVTSWSN